MENNEFVCSIVIENLESSGVRVSQVCRAIEEVGCMHPWWDEFRKGRIIIDETLADIFHKLIPGKPKGYWLDLQRRYSEGAFSNE